MAKSKNMATATRASNGWEKEHIQHLLMMSDKAVVRAVLQIYARQTAEEQRVGDTTVHNGQGFGGTDGEFLSNISEQLLRRPNSTLTEKQMKIVRPKMLKYWKQLLEIAAECPEGPTFPRPGPQPKRGKQGNQGSLI